MKLSLLPALFIILLISCGSNKSKQTVNDSIPEGLTDVELLKTTPDSGQSSPYSDMIISCNGVDFVTMGENIINKIPDFYTYENKTITHTEEGLETETRTLTISDMGIAIIRANLSTDEKITEITVFTTRANTDKGIGPGSKLDEFIQAYPDYKIWYNGVSAHFVIESPQCNCLQFQIDKQFYNSDMNKLRSGGKITYLKRNEFAAETVISSVRILKTN